jgi:hypothetical protein
MNGPRRRLNHPGAEQPHPQGVPIGRPPSATSTQGLGRFHVKMAPQAPPPTPHVRFYGNLCSASPLIWRRWAASGLPPSTPTRRTNPKLLPVAWGFCCWFTWPQGGSLLTTRPLDKPDRLRARLISDASPWPLPTDPAIRSAPARFAAAAAASAAAGAVELSLDRIAADFAVLCPALSRTWVLYRHCAAEACRPAAIERRRRAIVRAIIVRCDFRQPPAAFRLASSPHRGLWIEEKDGDG